MTGTAADTSRDSGQCFCAILPYPLYPHGQILKELSVHEAESPIHSADRR